MDWLVITPTRGKHRPDLDFLVITPNKGIVVFGLMDWLVIPPTRGKEILVQTTAHDFISYFSKLVASILYRLFLKND